MSVYSSESFCMKMWPDIVVVSIRSKTRPAVMLHICESKP